jgi:hypothetical protein
VDWPFSTYLTYMATTTDESPLYLFDHSFATKMSLPPTAYTPPPCFGLDYFTLLGASRPDHRWLIIGPARSGSTFHKDPNATSAWNAVVCGAKYWIMFPSSASLPPPPGVFVSADHAEVTSPLSIAEWLLTFHAEARNTPGCLEGTCAAGEVLHVPSGWWHLVVNLEPSIAITQNFVPEAYLRRAVDFLKNKPEQVSGFRQGVKDPYRLFMERLREHDAGLAEKYDANVEPKKRKWNEVVEPGAENESTPGKGFSFGFGDGDNEEIP